MARPLKRGLLYFPKDVDYYDDLKIMELINEYGPLGQTIYDIVISMIYKEGYYLEIPLDKLAFKIIRVIGNRWVKDKSLVLQVILYCADIGLFHKGLLTQSVITSTGIQRRYSEVTVRSKAIKDKYWLIDENGQPLESAPKTGVFAAKTQVNVTKTPVSDAIIPQKKSKEKKSKNPPKSPQGEEYAKNNDWEETFNRFWEAYPKKAGKGNCEKWFKSHKPNLDLLEEMLAAIRRQKQSEQWQRDDGKYIPFPYTWLNGKRWEDEPTNEGGGWNVLA